MTLRVVFIGECMLELSPAEGGLYALGFAGDVYNAAVNFRLAAPEAGVRFLTVTGDDALSGRMRAAWRGRGIGEALAFARPGSPGLYLIELQDGERSFHYWRSASPARRWMEALAAEGGAARLAGADLVYLSGISLAILPEADQDRALQLLLALRGRVGRIAFDPNLRPALWASMERAREIMTLAAAASDILLPSEEDLQGLGWSWDQLSGEVVVTTGAKGCRLLQEGAWLDLPAPPAVVRDTSGAGDAFHGTYLAARLRGADPAAAARAGLEAASRIVALPGALPPPPAA